MEYSLIFCLSQGRVCHRQLNWGKILVCLTIAYIVFTLCSITVEIFYMYKLSSQDKPFAYVSIIFFLHCKGGNWGTEELKGSHKFLQPVAEWYRNVGCQAPERVLSLALHALGKIRIYSPSCVWVNLMDSSQGENATSSHNA